MKKILLLTHSLDPHTGAGEFTGALVDNLRNSGYSFEIITGEDYLRPSYVRLLSKWIELGKLVKKADIIHALDAYPYGVLGYVLSLGLNKPLIITAVGTGSIQLLKKNNLKSYLLKKAYTKAAQITAISDYSRRKIREAIPGLSIKVINHGVSTEKYSDKKNLIFSDIKPYVLSVGEFKKRKGYEDMLETFSQLDEKYNYVIVANKNRNVRYLETLHQKMDELHIRDRVKILSSIQEADLVSLYQNAEAFLSMPQDDKGDVEGFGLSILEASASSTPSIVKRGSGADDAVKDGENGYLVDNMKEAVSKINKILNDKDLRKTLGNNARKYAEKNSWQNKVEEYKEIYDNKS